MPSKPFNSYKVAHTHYCPFYGGGVTTYLQKQDIFKRKLHLDTDKLFVIRDKLGSYQLPCFSSPGHTMVCRWINPFKPLSVYTVLGRIHLYKCFDFPLDQGGTHIQALTKKRVVCDSILFRDNQRLLGEMVGYFYCAHSPHIHVTLVDTCDSEWQTRQTYHLSMRLCKILFVICFAFCL